MNKTIYVLQSILGGFSKAFGGRPSGIPQNVIDALKKGPVELEIDLNNTDGRVSPTGFAMFTVNFKAGNGLPAFSGSIPAVDFIYLVNNEGKSRFQAKSWKTDDGQERWSIYNVDAPASVSNADIQAAIEYFAVAEAVAA